MLRNGDFFHHRTQLAQLLGGSAHAGVDVGFGVGMREAFLQHANPQAFHTAFNAGGVIQCAGLLFVELARVVAVDPGQHFQQQRVVFDVGGHGTGVVDHDLNRHDAAVGHETVRRLHANDAAPGRGHANRTALIAANGHVDFAQRDHHAAARRGPARGIAHFVGVVHRAFGVGVAAAGNAVVLAVGLAGDFAARVENAGDDGGVDVRHIAFQNRVAVHHRHAGDHDVVFHRDALAGQLAGGRAFDGGLHIPGVAWVLRRQRPVTRRARIFHFGEIVGQRIHHVVGGDIRREQPQIGVDIGFGEGQADAVGGFQQLLGG